MAPCLGLVPMSGFGPSSCVPVAPSGSGPEPEAVGGGAVSGAHTGAMGVALISSALYIAINGNIWLCMAIYASIYNYTWSYTP